MQACAPTSRSSVRSTRFTATELMRFVALALLLVVAFNVHAQDDLSSRRDYSDNLQRDVPIACKQGDIESFPGKTLGEVFGAAWPLQPVRSSPDAHVKAHLLDPAPMRWPRGLDPQDSVTVVAVLIDASGKALQAEILCSTRMGFGTAVRRHAMASTYAPTEVDGKPITSVFVRVVRFHAVERQRSTKPRRH